MAKSKLMDQYVQNLLQGKRQACRDLVWGALETGADPESLYYELLWPAMERVNTLFRDDAINIAAEHMATRINRFLADQIQRDLPKRTPNGRRLLILCAERESEELGAQIYADLFEARGWDVYFVGGGVPRDEILALAGQLRPELLLVYGMTPQGVPAIRGLIDLIRDVGAHPSMNIMVAGGIFGRAEDLWKEVNSDLYAPDPRAAVELAERAEARVPPPPEATGVRKRRRRRRNALLVQAVRPRVGC